MILCEELNSELWLPDAERERREALRKPKIVKAVGVDLGQARDYTAICVMEFQPGVTYIRGLERMNHLPYTATEDKPSIVRRVREIMAIPHLSDAQLLIDFTGVGRPVFDIFTQAGLKPIAIGITGGNAVHPAPKGYNVPKRDLVFSLVAMFQSGTLKIPAMSPEAQTLVNELMAFKMKIKSATMHDSYEAWREQDHDDLVLACSLPSWYYAYKYQRVKKRPASQGRWI